MPHAGSSRISPGFGSMRLGHERRHRAWGVVLAGIAGALEIVEDLLVHVAEVLLLGEVVEVDLVDLVDHLAEQLARLHVVVGVLEDGTDDALAVRLRSGRQSGP